MGILKEIVDALIKKKGDSRESPVSEKKNDEYVNEWCRHYSESFQASRDTHGESE